MGDLVTFEAFHLGRSRTLTARIIELDRPYRFVDEQVSGDFECLRHVHEFTAEGIGTRMTDVIEGQSPLGMLGTIADHLFVGRHMKRFLTRKLKRIAESAMGSAA